MKIKPLSPQEVRDLRLHVILPELIEAINEMLCENFDGTRSIKILQKDIVNKTVDKCHKKQINMTDQTLYLRGHLNFESIYEAVGWKVDYESPDRDESFESYFLFTPKKGK